MTGLIGMDEGSCSGYKFVMPDRSYILILVLACMLSVLAGTYLNRYFPAGPQPTPTPVAVQSPAPPVVPPAPAPAVEPPAESREEVQVLREELATTRHQKEQVENQLTEFINWLLTNYRGKYPLPESYFSRLRISPVAGGFALNPEVASLLNITPDEEEVITDAFEATRTFLQDTETALMTINEERPDKVVVRIPAFNEEGFQIREDLLSALEATLGRERFNRFMDVVEEDLDEVFLKFGEAARNIVFEVLYPGNDAAPLLTIKDGWITYDEEGHPVVTATQRTVAELPDEYFAYIDWLTDESARLE